MRQPQPQDTSKASCLSGQFLQLLRYRGLLERFKAASTNPSPAPRFPFCGVHLDFTHLADLPLHALGLPQPRLECLLNERAGELGADVRRGHEVVGVSQDDTTVTADVRGPDGGPLRDGNLSTVTGQDHYCTVRLFERYRNKPSVL